MHEDIDRFINTDRFINNSYNFIHVSDWLNLFKCFCSIKSYCDFDRSKIQFGGGALFLQHSCSPWQIPRVLFAVSNMWLYHKRSSKWPEEMWTSCQFWGHSGGRNSHNIVHNLSIRVAKWVYLWIWRAIFVLNNGVSEFKVSERDIFLKKSYFWCCHCHHNTPLAERLTPKPQFGGAGQRIFAWWESRWCPIEIRVPKYVNPRYYWFSENTFGVKIIFVLSLLKKS